MSQMKRLADVVEDLRRLADSLSNLAQGLESPVMDESKTEPEVTLEDVRRVLAKKTQAGFTKEIKELIQSFGEEKLSSVNPKHYKKILEAAEEMR